MKNSKYILLDAANTLIHKPGIWHSMVAVLHKHGYSVEMNQLQERHKLLSEIVAFPDRTSREFYQTFNAELLLMLGIIPTEGILSELFSACSYQPWEPFADTNWLNQSPVPVGVLSNFNRELPALLKRLFTCTFTHVIASEEQNVRKPELTFFNHAINLIGLSPDEILYVGDSLKLDIVPARQLGLQAVLIDRLNLYGWTMNARERVGSLDQILKLL